jgi:hypothetical protein
MSDEQQLIAIGRAVEDYATCRKRLAALMGEAAKVSATLAQIGQALRNPPHTSPTGISGILTVLDRHKQNFPTVDSLVSLVTEIHTEQLRKQQLHNQLRDMGAEPKD